MNKVDRRSCKTCGLVGGCGCVRERPKSVSTRLRWACEVCEWKTDDYGAFTMHLVEGCRAVNRIKNTIVPFL